MLLYIKRVGDKMDYTYGVDRIWEEDAEFQEVALTAVAEDIRQIDVDILRERKMFYVPNDEYLKHFFGDEVGNRYHGMYQDEYCLYYKRLMIPLTRMNGDIFGFCGYCNEEVEEGYIKYLFPPKRVFVKQRYAYITGEEYMSALLDNYIFITDGIFDQIRLSSLGYNAMALCSSKLTDFHIHFLSFIENKIVLPDTDQAGLDLARYCKRKMKGVTVWKQGDEWDIDDYLKGKERQSRFRGIFEQSKEQGFSCDIII